MEHKVNQGSEEWFALRLGKITASRFPKLMPTKRQKITDWNDTQLSILREIAAERLTGDSEDRFTSKAMQWGIDNESSARRALSTAIDMPIRESGFWEMSPHVGGSPDGIVGFDECVCELKCPTSKQHLRYLLDMDEFLKDYGWQVKSQMWITGIPYAFCASYDPRFPSDKMLSVREIELKTDDVDLLDNRIGEAVKYVLEMTGEIIDI